LAPLNPTTLSHFAVAGFAGAGNLWLRYPQLRLDVWGKAGTGRVGLTAGAVRPVGGSDPDTPGASLDAAGAGGRSGQPFWQGRAYYTRPVGQKTLAIGLSGHHGQESYRIGTAGQNADVDTWAVDGDLQIPLGRWLSIQGELFTGSNLDSFQ